MPSVSGLEVSAKLEGIHLAIRRLATKDVVVAVWLLI